MTLFIRLENGKPVGYPIEENNFRQIFPNISFPAKFTWDNVEPLGYGIYDFTNSPSTERYKKAVEIHPVRDNSGIWRQSWEIQEMTDPEKNAADEEKSKQVRQERNFKLAMSDWTQLPDAPVNREAWIEYRQALRDVTAQAGFPWQVEWPVPPE